ncbi:MAG: phenylalanine--tRNA ligase subunit alpha [bacterium]|nr:phenylalanine--tRNA ligase subunit alpha [bacterium]MDZ4231593.1 phenylalanine--tRNA ligase subunit alpha [Patescibacteria group bacterium]
MADLGSIEKKALGELTKVTDKIQLGRLRVKYLGRKGELTAVLRSLKDLTPTQKKTLGSKANQLRDKLQEAIDERFLELGEDSAPSIDITRPGRKISRGYVHPLTLIERDVRRIFLSLNFSVVEGPELENEFYNFDALNLPDWHPAREAWDTFWIKPQKGDKEKLLLRTHTSPVQVRFMEKNKPPFQIIVPGRVFRYEATDATHEANFYQFEGLMVGKDVSLANFKYVITKFFEEFFKGQAIEFRFRPSYFPFVEPGVEVDVRFKGGEWLEMLGAGMVHPNVFEAAHYNPREYQGFAFGVGVDRLAMIKYKIPDVRMLYAGDLRLIQQFK